VFERSTLEPYFFYPLNLFYGEIMEEKQKRKLSETGYPGRDTPAKSNAVDAKQSPGRHAEAVREHLKLRKGQ
jgi:hypothetical protein